MGSNKAVSAPALQANGPRFQVLRIKWKCSDYSLESPHYPVNEIRKKCRNLQEKNGAIKMQFCGFCYRWQCIADTIYSFVIVLKILPSLSVDQREAKKGKGRSYLYYLYLKGGGGGG